MKKNLVVYFSVYGSAKKTAEEIARQVNGDLIEIIPEIPYDSDRSHYNALARRAKEEHDSNMRPKIKNTIPVEDYENIFIGYPMWWYTFPMIVYTFLESHDFTGKNIIPFNTHMGSQDGGTYKTIAKMLKGAKVYPGLPLEMSKAEQGQGKKIHDWLEEIGFAE